MSGFTPGPWLAVMQFGSWMVRQDPKDWDGHGYQHICALPAGRKGSHYGEMFAANARLMAAAPELLEALKPLADIGIATAPDYLVRVDKASIERARAAIAKALNGAGAG